MAAKYSAADYIFQFVTVTVGMFIALMINGAVGAGSRVPGSRVPDPPFGGGVKCAEG